MYYSLNIEIAEDASELLQAVIDGTDPLGMQVRDHTLKPPPGSPPLPEGKVVFDIWYEDQPQAEEALRAVRAISAAPIAGITATGRPAAGRIRHQGRDGLSQKRVRNPVKYRMSASVVSSSASRSAAPMRRCARCKRS